MAEHGFMWIYLIFFLIPLARIIPRLVRKWQKKDNKFTENQFSHDAPRIEERQESFRSQESFSSQESFEKPQSKEMLVLGELNRGVKDFNKIQKNLEIDTQTLEEILKDLEDKRLMKVIKKNGITGMKVELHATEKGFKKFYT